MEQVEHLSSFSVLINQIAEKYLKEVYCIAILWVIAAKSYDNVPQVKYEQIGGNTTMIEDLGIYHHYNQFIWINLEDLNDENLERLMRRIVDLGCQAWIVDDVRVNKFLDTYGEIVETTEQRPQRVHMIFHLNNTQEEHLHQILSHRTLEDVPNVLLVIPSTRDDDENDGESFDLVTSSFAGRFNNTHPIVLDHFGAANFARNTNLFPDKLSNLQRRNLRLALFNYKPYTTVQHVAPGSGNANAMGTDEELTLFLDGTEVLMFQEFCIRHNCTLLISEDEEGQWGVIYENRTGDGLTGAVVERRAEVSVGAIYMWYYESTFLTLSTMISRTGVTCIAPKPALLPGWLTPVLPFSMQLWIAVLISFLLGIIIMQFLAKYRKSTALEASSSEQSFTKSILMVAEIYLMQSVKFIERKLVERILFGCILLTGWFIGNVYGSGLSSVMTIPRYLAPIDTSLQLAQSGMEWSGTHDAWTFSIQSATNHIMVTLVNTFHVYSYEDLRHRSERADIALGIERLQYGHFAIGDYIQEDILDNYQIMIEDIYWEYCIAMSYKTWSLMPKFDLLVMEVAQSGIQKYWELVVVQRHLNNKVQLGVAQSRHHDNLGPVSLQPKNLLGLFAVWAFGMILALIVFIIEVSCCRKPGGRKN
ncbi:uncharacterized protein LOC129796671 [Lutzomyia longipalpis]|uniref:uncharacterized protein LOC129796671 n=1 Tax=Lutzomyia longipalpis TaxID=7200 RepID=UPI0024840608|nr:uncharacterized protein LOC129796671 [Lutzomyia longipalpis]